MNNKGQVALFGLMLGLTLIIVVLAIAPSVVNSTNSARNATSGDTIGLDCGNSSISDFDKATCTSIDISSFYYIGTVLFIAGAVVTARKVFS